VPAPHWRLPDVDVWLCGCSGYVPIEGALADASFAESGSDAGANDHPIPRLRMVQR